MSQSRSIFSVNPTTIIRKNLEVIGGTRQLHTFRGAQCICDLGITDSSLCEWKSCGICSIIKSSFAVLEFGATGNAGRYGNGIYSYFDPSMADRFATSSLSSPYRAILLCEVNIPTPGSKALESPLVAKSVSTMTPSAQQWTETHLAGTPPPRPAITSVYLWPQPKPLSRDLWSCIAKKSDSNSRPGFECGRLSFCVCRDVPIIRNLSRSFSEMRRASSVYLNEVASGRQVGCRR